jgi:hypothetical protein
MVLWRPKWLVAGLTVAICFGAAGAAYSQFTSFNDGSRSMLEGNWQSCVEADGQYAERIYDGKAPGLGPFELHMGPHREFALFRGTQDEHRDHTSAGNLLKPHIVDVGQTSTQKWQVEGLQLEVSLAGGSRGDCESWFITLRRAGSVVSHQIFEPNLDSNPSPRWPEGVTLRRHHSATNSTR